MKLGAAAKRKSLKINKNANTTTSWRMCAFETPRKRQDLGARKPKTEEKWAEGAPIPKPTKEGSAFL